MGHVKETCFAKGGGQEHDVPDWWKEMQAAREKKEPETANAASKDSATDKDENYALITIPMAATSHDEDEEFALVLTSGHDPQVYAVPIPTDIIIEPSRFPNYREIDAEPIEATDGRSSTIGRGDSCVTLPDCEGIEPITIYRGEDAMPELVDVELEGEDLPGPNPITPASQPLPNERMYNSPQKSIETHTENSTVPKSSECALPEPAEQGIDSGHQVTPSGKVEYTVPKSNINNPLPMSETPGPTPPKDRRSSLAGRPQFDEAAYAHGKRRSAKGAVFVESTMVVEGDQSPERGGAEVEPTITGSNWFREAVHDPMSAIHINHAINGPESAEWTEAIAAEFIQIEKLGTDTISLHQEAYVGHPLARVKLKKFRKLPNIT